MSTMSPKDNLERMLKLTNYSAKMPYVDREPTFRAMCEFVKARQMMLDAKDEQVTIFETGCVRLFEDYGAGYSTVIFDTLLRSLNKGYLTSVDISKQNAKIAKSLGMTRSCGTTSRWPARSGCRRWSRCTASVKPAGRSMPARRSWASTTAT